MPFNRLDACRIEVKCIRIVEYLPRRDHSWCTSGGGRRMANPDDDLQTFGIAYTASG